MKYLKFQTLVLLFVFLADCVNSVPPAGYPQNPNAPNYYPSAGYPPPGNDAYYDRRIREDGDRDEVLRRSGDRRRGDICEDEDRDHECKDQCRDMFRRINDREDCEELTVQQIDKLLDVHKALEDADDRDLRDIDLEDLEVYLNVSIAGFDSLVRRYKSSEAKDVLIWIANNEDVTDTFEDEDDDYRILESLLKVISSFSDSELERPFTRDIYRGTLFEVAIDARNESAMDWFLNYIFYTDGACNDDEEVSSACFTVICKIGDGFEDEDFLRDWLEFGIFEDYIDDIIKGEVNAGSDPKWDASDIDDSRDLYEGSYEDQTWVTTLCGGLT